MAEWKKVIVSGSNAVLNTVQAPGGFTGNLTGNVTGNASTATALATGRTFSLSGGDVTATGVSFDGTGNVTLNANIATGAIDTNMFASATKTNISGAFVSTSASIAADIASIIATGYDLDFGGDSGTGVITNEEQFTIAGGTNITTVGSTNTLTVNLDDQISLTGITGSLRGNASTATALETARTIGGVSFNGTANINLPGVNTAGNQNTTGTAASASVLATARTIALSGGDVTATGVSFDGSANISLTANIAAGAIDTVMFASATKTDISGAFVSTSASIAADIAALVSTSYDLDINGDTGTGVIDNEEALTIAGGNGIVTVMSGNTLTITAAEGVVSASAFSSPSQGTVRATINGVQTDVDTGLQSGDSPTFASLTLTGDLTVNGTTTTISTTNLEVEDQFISLNDQGVPADAGIVVEGKGTAFGWDQSASRWAFDFEGAVSEQTTIGADAYAVAVVTTDDANYRYNGNIRVTLGDIFIYVE